MVENKRSLSQSGLEVLLLTASRDTPISRPDTPLWKAVAYIAEKIGEVKDTTFFPRTRALIEEKAIASELRIWGCKQLDADPEWVNTRKFAIRHTPIPSDYWSLSKLAPYCTVEPVMEDEDHNRRVVDNVPCTQEADKGIWQKKRNSYADLQVSWSQIERIWERNAEQQDCMSAQNQLKEKIFSEKLTGWREWLVGLQERLCIDFMKVALINRELLARDPLDWITERVEAFWAPRQRGFQNWVKVCCDASDADDWLAPNWLLTQMPDKTLKHLPYPVQVTSDGRVLPPHTAGILVSIANFISMRLETSKLRVLDDAKIRIASERGPTHGERSAFSIENVTSAAHAIYRKYGYEWDRKWEESTHELHAVLHAMDSTASDGPNSSEMVDKEIVRRGKRCDTIVAELKTIKSLVGRGLTVSEIHGQKPEFLVWEVEKGLSGEDVETFRHPNRWGPTVGYAFGLLGKEYGRSASTIKDWRKAARSMRNK
jgi:hypothetical protein